MTNTLVSLGSIRQSDEFKRAFAAATVHDFFNLLAVLILLPIELATGVSSIAESITEALGGSAGSEWKNPIKQWVKEPVGWSKDLLGDLGLEASSARRWCSSGCSWCSRSCSHRNMKQLVADRVERSLNAVLGSGGGAVAMLVGLIDDRRPILEHHNLDHGAACRRGRRPCAASSP